MEDGDDIYVIGSPRGVLEVHGVLQEELWARARIRIHHGKTQLWNRGGSQPAGVVEVTLAARSVEPDAVVWKSDLELPLSQDGLRVLGVPIGHPLYIVDQLASKSEEQEFLFQRIPAVEDLQAAWLLLLFCGATRANFWLRMIQPDLSLPFAERHDDRVGDCLTSLLHVL